ncbi:MAG: hypothetical protein HY720_06475 [Planctomycetes bacterium]|nr:hypothetical protein [Planctomycetota bacterium]
MSNAVLVRGRACALQCLAPLVLLALGAPALAAPDIEADEDHVYYGDPDLAEKPGVISANTVFLEIPAYKRIVDEKIPKDDPRYWLLMEEANRIFMAALRATDRNHGYDLIGELGSIKVDGKPAPDITSTVVEEVRKIVRNGADGK